MDRQKPTKTKQSNAAASILALAGAVATTAANFGIAYLVSKPGAANAGVYFVAISILTILGNSSCLGTMTAMVYFMPRVTEEGRNNPRSLLRLALLPVASLGIFLAVALYLLAPTISTIVAEKGAEDVKDILQLAAIGIPAWGITVTLLGATRALGSMTPTAGIGRIFRPTAQLVLISYVTFFIEDAPTSYLAIAWVIPVILSLLFSIGAVQYLGGFENNGESPIQKKEFWNYVRPRSFSTVLQIVLERFDVVLVSALAPQAGLSGEVASGIYGALSRYITAANFLVASLAQAVAPKIRKSLAKKNKLRVQKLIDQTTGWMVFFVWPYLLIVFVHAETLLRLIDPEMVPGVPALRILAIGVLISPMMGPADSTLLMLGKSKISLKIMILTGGVNGVLAFLLIPRFGIEGAAFAWAIAVAIQNIFAFTFVHRNAQFRPYPGTPAILAAGGAFVSVLAIGVWVPKTFGGMILNLVISGIVFLLWSFLFAETLSLPFAKLLKKK